MPSSIVTYIPGSGFTPLFSGNPWSGRVEPVGGIQLRADRANSGNLYISLSGGNLYSGQFGTLVGSGGPTITSGQGWGSGILSGQMDGMQLGPGDPYLIPRLAFQLGQGSGYFQICAGADPACSGGFARIYSEAY